MITVQASEFKAKCLQMMDQVAATGEPILITKRGRPVARLMPPERKRFYIGALKGMISIPDDADIISPTGESWEPRTLPDWP